MSICSAFPLRGRKTTVVIAAVRFNDKRNGKSFQFDSFEQWSVAYAAQDWVTGRLLLTIRHLRQNNNYTSCSLTSFYQFFFLSQIQQVFRSQNKWEKIFTTSKTMVGLSSGRGLWSQHATIWCSLFSAFPTHAQRKRNFEWASMYWSAEAKAKRRMKWK